MIEKRKVLFIATEDQGHIMKFHLPYLKEFQKAGFEVHVACAGDQEIPYCDRKISIPFHREPLRYTNFLAYKKLKQAVESDNYEIIHCHTPVGGVLGRLAARKVRRKGTKVMYTAHGFHFFRGSSRLSWLLYYPVEKFLSQWTDCLVTINKEDYRMAEERHFHAKRLAYVHGMGVDLNRFYQASVEEQCSLRRELGLSDDAFVMLLAADYNRNKNQKLLIRTVEALKEEVPEIMLLLVGEGILATEYRTMVRDLNLEDHVRILGFRRDICKLLKASDLAVSGSFREGLPVFLMEAMATGLPIVATDCRGNRDLVIDGKNGRLVGIDSLDEFVEAVKQLSGSKEERHAMGAEALQAVCLYNQEAVIEEMRGVYQACLTE